MSDLGDDIRELVDLLTDRTDRVPGWLTHLHQRLDRIEEKLVALVQIDQDDLNNFATQIEAQVTALNTAATTVATYIQQLLANQATPLPAADETTLTQALSDLTTAGTAVAALEPPAPAPAPEPTPTPDPTPTPVVSPTTGATPVQAGTLDPSTEVYVVDSTGAVPADAVAVTAGSVAADTLVVPVSTGS